MSRIHMKASACRFVIVERLDNLNLRLSGNLKKTQSRANPAVNYMFRVNRCFTTDFENISIHFKPMLQLYNVCVYVCRGYRNRTLA